MPRGHRVTKIQREISARLQRQPRRRNFRGGVVRESSSLLVFDELLENPYIQLLHCIPGGTESQLQTNQPFHSMASIIPSWQRAVTRNPGANSSIAMMAVGDEFRPHCRLAPSANRTESRRVSMLRVLRSRCGSASGRSSGICGKDCPQVQLISCSALIARTGTRRSVSLASFRSISRGEPPWASW